MCFCNFVSQSFPLNRNSFHVRQLSCCVATGAVNRKLEESFHGANGLNLKSFSFMGFFQTFCQVLCVLSVLSMFQQM
jgi:hypothetical protein